MISAAQRDIEIYQLKNGAWYSIISMPNISSTFLKYWNLLPLQTQQQCIDCWNREMFKGWSLIAWGTYPLDILLITSIISQLKYPLEKIRSRAFMCSMRDLFSYVFHAWPVQLCVPCVTCSVMCFMRDLFSLLLNQFPPRIWQLSGVIY